MTTAEHNKTIAILSLIAGSIHILFGLLFGMAALGMGGIGLLAFLDPNAPAGVGGIFTVMTIFNLVVFLICFLSGIVPIISGWKLLKMKPNAKTWGIIGAVALWFTIGFPVSIYYLIVFVATEDGKEFLRINGMK